MKFRIDLKILFFLCLFFLSKQLDIYLIVLFFTFLHEIAHLIVGATLRLKPQYIEMTPFGFWISFKPRIQDYREKIKKSNVVELKYIMVAIAGPLFNLFLVMVMGNNFKFLGENTIQQKILYTNFLIFLFNLIPIYPLDGGRIFRSLFRIYLGKKAADQSINILANISVIVLTIAGSIAILYLKNIAVLVVLAYLWELVILENKRFKLKKKIWNLSSEYKN